MQEVSNLLKQSIFDKYSINLDSITVSRPDPQFGDYASNVAMQLAPEVGSSPRQIAQDICDALAGRNCEWLKSASVAGPGFINIFVTDQYLFSQWNLDVEKIYQDQTVLVEYSDPNPFKALHAGHLYTTLVGNAIANLMARAGGKVIRLNYGGDVGLHVAKAMYGIIKYLGGEFPQELAEIDPNERAAWVSQRYVEGNIAYDSDKSANEEIIKINSLIYDLHKNGDTQSNFAQIYWTCREWSYQGFIELYNNLDVAPFNEFIAESKVTPLGMAMVDEGLTKSYFKESDGAIIYDGEQSGLHTRVFINSNGLPTYEAKELGLAAYKWQNYTFNKNIVITGNDIVEYMKVLFSAIDNFYPDFSKLSNHLTHGMIKFVGGEKMSSRTGNVLMASDIIESARKANTSASGKEDDRVAIGAIKYAFLKQRMGADIIYNPEESISLQGNSGPYIQYAHARARSILQKVSNSTAIVGVDNLDENERLLASTLADYPKTLTSAIFDITPHIICTYLYELSQAFNRFYENSKVVGSDRQEVRLELTRRYADTLKDGLSVLGIVAPDSM